MGHRPLHKQKNKTDRLFSGTNCIIIIEEHKTARTAHNHLHMMGKQNAEKRYLKNFIIKYYQAG